MMWRRMIAVLVFTSLLGCSPFSDMQSGRVLDKGEREVTPYYSTMSIAGSGGSAKVQTGYGVIAGVGLAEHRKADLRVRYEHITFGDYVQTVQLSAFAPSYLHRLG